MRIYVAGIHASALGFGDHFKKTRMIIPYLKKINDDAIEAMGPNVVIVVALQEYALTPKAIPNADKKRCLRQLQSVVNFFPNMILVPGSFAAFDGVDEKPDRMHKIVDHYKFFNETFLSKDGVFADSWDKVKKVRDLKLTSKTLRLQNCTYVLTAKEADAEAPVKYKHKKTVPWNEELKLKNPDSGIFDVGVNDLVRTVNVAGRQIDMGVIICRDHNYYTVNKVKRSTQLPLLQVVVSASVKVKKEKLFGAVTVQMDSNDNLGVFINHEHPQYRSSLDVKSRQYYIFNARITHSRMPVCHYNVPEKDLNDMSCLRAHSMYKRRGDHFSGSDRERHAHKKSHVRVMMPQG